MKRILSISLVAIFTVIAAIFYGSSSAQAQAVPTAPTQSVRCDIAQARLNTRIIQVDKTKETQTKTYTDLQAKVDAYIISAKAVSYDTTNLTAARDTVKTALEAYTTKATAYTTSLMATKNLSCGESTPAFTTSLATTRIALTDTRTSTLAVRTALKDKVIPALTAYATWLKDNAKTEEAK